MLESDHMTLRKSSLAAALAVALALAMPALAQAPAATKPAPATSAAPSVFATPEDGAAALAAAVRAGDPQMLLTAVGPDSKSWLFSGDKVADRADWKKFLELYDAKHAIERTADGKAIVSVGADAWPFPAPLVKTPAGWHFDSEAGRMEVLKRRIGRNELDTIQTLLAVVDAEREYVRTDYDRDGYSTYAMRIRSSPGKKDGLYWPTPAGAPQSPLGPLVAEATKEGYSTTNPTPQPYHGYLFRLMTSQGPAARGGAMDYMAHGRLFGGFAVIAWPAKYANSGIMTFIVNHEGVVYQRDLGDNTAQAVAKITAFNPDKSWARAQK
jgi:hypothetical protein